MRFLTDENFNEMIVRGLLRRSKGLDLLSVRQAGLESAEDPIVLASAAEEGRIVLTHDVNTMPGFAADRIKRGLRMPGLFVVPSSAQIGGIIDDLLLITQCSSDDEWEKQTLFLPL